ncbi:MAG: flippase [Proteobacteria bacterium]|nr:flippase [Pseudomonadota bacterium]
MSENNALKKIAKGGIIYTAGRFGATFLQFISGLIVIHAIEKSEYGLLSLGQVWLGIAVSFSSLGLGSGLPRIIAKYTTKGGKEDIDAVISSSLHITLIVSALISLIFFCVTIWFIEAKGNHQFAYVLYFFSFMIVPTVMINTLSTIFRGFEKIEPEAVFNNIIPNTLRILLLILIVFMGMRIKGVLIANVATIWMTLCLFILYSSKHLIKNLSFLNLRSFSKEIFLFSLPLMGVQLMGQLMNWVPMLMIGHYHLADEVGLFNAPSRLAVLFPIPLLAIATLYLPIATKHYEEQNILKIKELYASTTKWSFLLTLPICLYATLDSQFIVTTLFGTEYLNSAPVLIALSIGSSIHSLLGPNGITLLSCGNRKIVFWSTVLSTILVVVASLILIPHYGAIGAAIAFTSAISVSNICISLLLNRYYHIHPFSRNYIKPVLFTIAIAIGCYFLMDLLNIKAWYIHILFLFVLISISLLSPVLTRSLSQDDLDMLKMIEFRIHRKTTVAEKLKGVI